MPAVQKETETGIKWFGEYDMNPKSGRPASDFPSDYNDYAVKQLQAEVSQMKRVIDEDTFRGKDLRTYRASYQQKKERLDAILNHRKDIEKRLQANGVGDKVYKAYNDLCEKVGDSLFTYSSMMRMADDPQIEANRMEGPCIEVKDPVVAEICEQAGYKLVRGKISRTRADIVRKIIGKHIGVESRDMEVLRKEDNDTRGRKVFQVPANIA
jgi:hypothetical protein